MHLFCDCSHGYPIRCAHNRIKNFHFPSRQHHPTKFDQFRRRIGHSLGHLPRQNIPAGDKRLVHQIYPRNHHKQFPICYCNILQLFLPSFQILQLVLNLKSKKNICKWDVSPLFSLVDTVYSFSVKPRVQDHLTEIDFETKIEIAQIRWANLLIISIIKRVYHVRLLLFVPFFSLSPLSKALQLISFNDL